MITNSGEMRHKCVLERATSAADDVGQMIKSWDSLETFWGKVTSHPTGLQVMGEHTSAFMRYTIKTKKTLAVVGDRVITEGHTIEITSVGIKNFVNGIEATLEGAEKVA